MLKPGDSGDAGVLVFKSQRFASDERLRKALCPAAQQSGAPTTSRVSCLEKRL